MHTMETPENEKVVRLSIGGRSVLVESFAFDRTYAGVLAYSPKHYKEMNEGIVNRQNYPTDWGENRNKLIVRPSEESINTLLPPFIYKAWCISDPVKKDKGYDESGLIVIWFDQIPSERSVKEIIESGMQEIDWEKYAQDYHF